MKTPEIFAFVLEHVRQTLPDDEDAKLIGVYSSESAAQKAIKRLRRQPGFRDFPDGFCIDRYRIDEDSWAEGFVWPG